jgi:hypothetical protein
MEVKLNNEAHDITLEPDYVNGYPINMKCDGKLIVSIRSDGCICVYGDSGTPCKTAWISDLFGLKLVKE